MATAQDDPPENFLACENGFGADVNAGNESGGFDLCNPCVAVINNRRMSFPRIFSDRVLPVAITVRVQKKTRQPGVSYEYRVNSAAGAARPEGHDHRRKHSPT